jgi:biotin operon repressor
VFVPPKLIEPVYLLAYQQHGQPQSGADLSQQISPGFGPA